MAIKATGNSARNTLDSANWAGKMVELIHRQSGTVSQKEILELVKLGQVTGVLRKDLEPQLATGIIWGIKQLCHDRQLFSGDLIENIVEILLKGLNRKGDVRESN